MVWKPILPDWSHLSLAQQVAQLVVVRASGHWFDSQIRYPQWEPPAATLRHWIADLGVGGVILLGGSGPELALRTQQLQEWAEIPLLLAADIEEGVGQRFAGASWMPPPLALGAIARRDLALAQDYARRFGRLTAQEAVALGLNWVLAPVADVNNNPQNPVINVRAFGETPEIVADLVAAFIEGCQGQGVLTTAKHFPGHGDTAIDSHLELPELPHSRDRLETLEWVPFQRAIAAGVSSIMTAHLQVPSLDLYRPATLSHAVLTGILRQQWGFEGVIVTDALMMQAITQNYGAMEAPILALEAGADVVLMPVDPPRAIAAIVEAVEQGRIPEDHIHQSLERLWRAKLSVCSPVEGTSVCHSWDWEATPSLQLETVAPPEAEELCREILQESMAVWPSPPAPLPVGEGSLEALPLAPLPVGEGSLEALPLAPLPVGEGSLETLPSSDSLSLRERARVRGIHHNVPADALNLIWVDNLLLAPFLGMQTPAIALPQAWGYQTRWCDRNSPPQPLGDLRHPTLLQVFLRGNPFLGSAGANQGAIEQWLKTLLDQDCLWGLVIYGSPYIWEQWQPLLPETVPAVFTYGQMPAAQAIALATLSHAMPTAPDRDLTQAFTT
ncbi:MAG: glycoside hydrolase family 3 N-terminal domain-containing protein [Prochlorothrix sp.]